MKKNEKVFDEKYNILNQEQKCAVDTIEGPVFVMAGPGTGKTQILTLRIANILRKVDHIEPENILALTFTNGASYNMRERLAQIIGGDLAYRVAIFTFHAFAEEVIKKNLEYFPQFIGARLISPVEQIEVLEKILEDMPELVHFSKFKRRENTLKNIAFSIGKIKGEALSVDDFIEQINEKYEEDRENPGMFYKRKYGNFNKGDLKISALRKLDQKKEKTLELAEIYRKYQEVLKKKKKYDFSDLIFHFVNTLETNSSFQGEIQEQYQYILVDEHQDTNDAQNRILHALIDNPVWEAKPNIFVVGDKKQAIFRFAGASEKSYAFLINKLSDVQLIHLENNYRSHQNILDNSHALITKSDLHKEEKKLLAFFDEGGIMQYRRFQNDKMEVLFVAQEITKAIKEGKDPDEIAVLYRNNKDGAEIRNLLSIYGVPVQDFSKINILKDRDMMKIFLLLSSIYDLSNNEVLAKSLFIDFLGFDIFAVQKIINLARSSRSSEKKMIYTLISEEKYLKEISLSEKEIKKFKDYAKFLASAKSFSENEDFLNFFSWFIRESGVLKYFLGHKNSSLGIAKLEKLFDEIKKESLGRKDFSFKDFIQYLSVLKKHNISMSLNPTISSGVQLMTFHGSKGLEFENVYIIKALEKRKLASEISLPFEDFSNGERDDERRLFYVAITRAKHACHISSHILDAQGKEKNSSIFIDDIDHLEFVDVSDWEKEHKNDIIDLFGETQEHIASLLDKEYIEKLFFSKQLSISALNNYIESPLKYFFRNLISLPEARSHFLDFGNFMHESLEHYFNLCKKEQKILGVDILKNSFLYVLDKKPHYFEFKNRAWGILESYHAHYREKFVLPLENELAVRGIPFVVDDGEEILLSGIIDKITKDKNGVLTVWDYKTGRAYSDMGKERREKIKRQAVFYKILLSHAYGGKYNFSYAIFDFLEKNTKGEYEQVKFEINQSDVEELKKQIMDLVQDIKNGTLLEKDFSKDSTNAELLEFLEVMRGPRTAEQLDLFN